MTKKMFGLSVLICFVMIVTLMSGCSTKNSASDKPKDQGNAQSNNQQKQNDGGNSDSQTEKMKLRFFTYYPEQTKIDGFFMNFLKNKFNFDAEFIVSSGETAKEKLNLMLASGDIPDFFGASTFEEYDKMIDQGIVGEINPEDLKTYAPRFWEFLHRVAGDDPFMNTRRNGKVYGIPGLWDLGPHVYTVNFREDWLKKVGITKTPETLDEMEEALKKFRNDDPDGNGKQDTYGITGTAESVDTLFTYVFGAYGVYPGIFTEDNGKIVRGEILPGAKDALTVLNRWYQEGLIDQEFIVNKGKNVEDKMVQEKAGAVGTYWYGYAPTGVFCCNDAYVALNKKNPQASFVSIPGPKGPDGKYGMVQTNPVYGAVSVFGKQLEKDHDKLVKYLELFDYTSFDVEAKIAIRYGEEGKTFNRNSDGSFSYIPPYDDQKERWKYGFDGAYSVPGGWNDDYNLELASFDTPDKSMMPIREKLMNMGTGKYEILNSITKPIFNDHQERLNKLTMQAFIDMITGKKPISEFDNYVAEWNKMGGDKVMEEAQQAYDKLVQK